MIVRIFLCVLILSGLLYAFISKQNQIMELRLQIPHLAKQTEELKQENIRLQFEIDQFESPSHLMELAREPQYRYLKHPLSKDVIELK